MIIDGDLTCMHEIDEWIDDAQKKELHAGITCKQEKYITSLLISKIVVHKSIAIFEKLREFVVIGNAKEFFATDRYIFRGLDNKWEPECKHSEKALKVSLPRFLCCRRRKARLLIVDRIPSVLREYNGRYR